MMLNTPKVESLSYVTDPLQKEKIKLADLSLLAVFGHSQLLLMVTVCCYFTESYFVTFYDETSSITRGISTK